jgi:hypothetical protein
MRKAGPGTLLITEIAERRLALDEVNGRAV